MVKINERLERELDSNATTAIVLSAIGIVFMGVILNTVALVMAIKIKNQTRLYDTYKKAMIALAMSGVQLAIYGLILIALLMSM